jgi:hypothetical protein
VLLHLRINWLIYWNQNLSSLGFWALPIATMSLTELMDWVSYARPVYVRSVGFSVLILWKISNPFPVQQTREQRPFRLVSHSYYYVNIPANFIIRQQRTPQGFNSNTMFILYYRNMGCLK